MRNKLGLYIHIPFCAAKCRYCDFYSLPGQEAQWDAYYEELRRRLARWGGRCRDYTVDTVYFGGGTPSLPGGERLASLMDTIRANYVLEDGAEVTCEANPDSASAEFLGRAAAVGVNRLSLGVQTADEAELRRIGRVHTFEQAVRAVEQAREAGFRNLSLDLMYALPGQTEDSLRRSAEALLALEPEHLSCYGLTLEPNTPMGRENPALPDGDTQAEWYLMICRLMREHGMEHYEISNFARPGFRSRHNSRYWKQQPYLGFGPGAHSDFEGRRLENPRSLEKWRAGGPTEEDAGIDRAAEYLMLSLRTSDGADSGEFEQRFGRSFAPVKPVLRQLEKHGLARRDGTRWCLTEEGFLLSNPVLVSVLEALEADG